MAPVKQVVDVVVVKSLLGIKGTKSNERGFAPS
jgi:hypothetical protein